MQQYRFAVKRVPEPETLEPLLLNFSRNCPSTRSHIRDNIILFIATYKRQDNLYLVFPYVEKSLEDLLEGDESEPIDPSQAPTHWLWKEFRGVVRAMNYFHRELGRDGFEKPIGVLHFDLKPENIMVTKNNKLKIIDFGESVFIVSGNDPEQVARYGTGDLVYQAPEVYQPDEDYRQEVRQAITSSSVYGTSTTPLNAVLLSYDVWQLACIMLLILTWIFEGSRGVNSLHNERMHGPNNTYFFRSTGPKGPRTFVRRKWAALEDLCSQSREYLRTLVFVGDVRELAKRMFEVNPHKRVQSDNVDARLARIDTKFSLPHDLELSRLVRKMLRMPRVRNRQSLYEVGQPSRRGFVSMGKL